MEPIIIESRISKNLAENQQYFDEKLRVGMNYDMLTSKLQIAGKSAVLYYINGMYKDELMQKVLQYLFSIKGEEMPRSASEFLQNNIPCTEVELEDRKEKILINILAGQIALLVDGFDKCFVFDARQFPTRGVEEPPKDKTLRGSKDGFVETIVSNTALIRRRIRDTDLCIEMMQAGESSHTDIAVCYMADRVDHDFLYDLKSRIKGLHVDALSMNQQSLAESLYEKHWFNPFPKYRYSERPDTTAAQILEGNIVIFVDNAPQAMILPTSLFDITEEVDDYYFPPVTGTYLRLARLLITVVSYFITPLYLLLMQHPAWIPDKYQFIMLKETSNIPVFWQLIILEIALDGLKLAAVNTPNMLSTPLSIMAALVMGDFSVSSGWFNAEIMLYMSFVAVANYSQTNYELAYAVKFMRILNLILTVCFGVYGFIAGIGIALIALINNRMVSGRGYLYPLIPFDWKKLRTRLTRRNIHQV